MRRRQICGMMLLYLVACLAILSSSNIVVGEENNGVGTISSEGGRTATITKMEQRDGAVYLIAEGEGALDVSTSTAARMAELEKGKPYALPSINIQDGFTYVISENIGNGFVAWKGTMMYVLLPTKDTLSLFDQRGVRVSIADTFDGEIGIAGRTLKAGETWKIGFGSPVRGDSDATYTDKNSYFRFIPPHDWQKKEFKDPRSKVEFYVPMGIGENRRASLFVLAHPAATLSPNGKGKVDLIANAKDRVAKLKDAGAKDARYRVFRFCDVNAIQIDATLPYTQVRMHAVWFVKYDRSYTISFTTQPPFYQEYLPIIDRAFSTFRCISPMGTEDVTQADRERIQQEQIRVWINALKGPDLVEEAEHRLLEIGKPAIPALVEARKSGTEPQRQRVAKLLDILTVQQRNRSDKPTFGQSPPTLVTSQEGGKSVDTESEEARLETKLTAVLEQGTAFDPVLQRLMPLSIEYSGTSIRFYSRNELSLAKQASEAAGAVSSIAAMYGDLANFRRKFVQSKVKEWDGDPCLVDLFTEATEEHQKRMVSLLRKTDDANEPEERFDLKAKVHDIVSSYSKEKRETLKGILRINGLDAVVDKGIRCVGAAVENLPDADKVLYQATRDIIAARNAVIPFVNLAVIAGRLHSYECVSGTSRQDLSAFWVELREIAAGIMRGEDVKSQIVGLDEKTKNLKPDGESNEQQ